jgi:hypothetical protein
MLTPITLSRLAFASVRSLAAESRLRGIKKPEGFFSLQIALSF